MRRLPPAVWLGLIGNYLQRERAPITSTDWEAMAEAAQAAFPVASVCRHFVPIFKVATPGIEVAGRRRQQRPPEIGAAVELSIIHHDFRLSEGELATPRLVGEAADAAAVCALAVDHLVLNGHPQLPVPGLLAAAGQRVALTGWRAPHIFGRRVAEAASLLEGAGYGRSLALVMSPDLAEHFDPQATHADGHCVPITAGVHVPQVFQETAALLLSANSEVLDLALAQDLTVGYLGEEDGRHGFRALMILALRVKEPAGICALTETH